MGNNNQPVNDQLGHMGGGATKLPVHLILDIGGFFFYLFELHSFFTQPQIFSFQDFSLPLYPLKLIALVIVIPLCYLFELAYFFELGDAMSYAVSIILRVENSNIFAQIKIFEYTVYFLLSLFLVGRLISFF